MKRTLLLLGAALAFNFAVPVNVDAASRSRVVKRVVDRCDYCAAPVFAHRYVAGYSRHGAPIYRWRTVSHQHSMNRYARPYYRDRDWYRDRDIHVRDPYDRYDPRWRERTYRSSPNYLRFPRMSILDD